MQIMSSAQHNCKRVIQLYAINSNKYVIGILKVAITTNFYAMVINIIANATNIVTTAPNKVATATNIFAIAIKLYAIATNNLGINVMFIEKSANFVATGIQAHLKTAFIAI